MTNSYIEEAKKIASALHAMDYRFNYSPKEYPEAVNIIASALEMAAKSAAETAFQLADMTFGPENKNQEAIALREEKRTLKELLGECEHWIKWAVSCMAANGNDTSLLEEGKKVILAIQMFKDGGTHHDKQ